MMIEIRRRSRLARSLLFLASVAPRRFALPIFSLALGRMVCKYRIRHGEWQSFKSAPQCCAVQLFAGEELTTW